MVRNQKLNRTRICKLTYTSCVEVTTTKKHGSASLLSLKSAVGPSGKTKIENLKHRRSGRRPSPRRSGWARNESQVSLVISIYEKVCGFKSANLLKLIPFKLEFSLA